MRAITALIVSNILFIGSTGYLVIKEARSPPVYADHIRKIDLDIKHGGLVKITLGVSSNAGGQVPADAHDSNMLVLTPRAAIQLDSAITKIIRTVQEAASTRS